MEGTPLSTVQPAAVPETSAASTPTESSDQDSGNTPRSGTRSGDGRIPATPHSAAGMRTEPPVSVPTASGTNPAATAAAEPALEPPAIRRGSCGLAHGPLAARSPVGP
jgi:hypothetical protein